jgi:hypothetical protein
VNIVCGLRPQYAVACARPWPPKIPSPGLPIPYNAGANPVQVFLLFLSKKQMKKNFWRCTVGCLPKTGRQKFSALPPKGDETRKKARPKFSMAVSQGLTQAATIFPDDLQGGSPILVLGPQGEDTMTRAPTNTISYWSLMYFCFPLNQAVGIFFPNNNGPWRTLCSMVKRQPSSTSSQYIL